MKDLSLTDIMWMFALNPIKELSQHGGGKYVTELMDAACGDVGMELVQGWVWHAKWFSPRCPARNYIACDVDKVLWPEPAQRHDAKAE